MNADKLRHKVTIQERGITTDEGGGKVEGWVNVQTVWANVRPSSASELTLGMQTQQQVTHTVEMRYRAVNKSQQRLLFNGRPLEIQTVVNVGQRGEQLQIKCLER
jgi:SPP1 family predicted phage head-tail adaptor